MEDGLKHLIEHCRSIKSYLSMKVFSLLYEIATFSSSQVQWAKLIWEKSFSTILFSGGHMHTSKTELGLTFQICVVMLPLHASTRLEKIDEYLLHLLYSPLRLAVDN